MAKASDIRKSLEAQLKDRGADVLHFQALLDDYMFFYQQSKKMQADVRRNGTTIKALSSTGKEYDKENPAVKAAVMYSKQMLVILKEMDLTTDTCAPQDNEDGDL